MFQPKSNSLTCFSPARHALSHRSVVRLVNNDTRSVLNQPSHFLYLTEQVVGPRSVWLTARRVFYVLVVQRNVSKLCAFGRFSLLGLQPLGLKQKARVALVSVKSSPVTAEAAVALSVNERMVVLCIEVCQTIERLMPYDICRGNKLLKETVMININVPDA